MINTNLKIKRKLLPIFIQTIEDELFQGAQKYKGSDDKEWTDTLMEFDEKFMLTTMLKYIGRIKNGDSRAKRDLSKIATYAFLQWVKMFGAVELTKFSEEELSE